MLRKWMIVLCVGLLMLLAAVTGYTADDEEYDTDAVMQQAVANKDKFPPEIAALVQPKVTVTNHTYSADPISRSFVWIEFYGEKPVDAYPGGIFQETSYYFKLASYDSNSDMGKFYIQSEQNNIRPEAYRNARQMMKDLSFNNSDPSSVVETKTGYGIALYRKFHFPSLPDGCGFSPEQTYYYCYYVGQVKDIFFEYQVGPIATDKAQVEQWFQNMIAKMQGISIAQLLK